MTSETLPLARQRHDRFKADFSTVLNTQTAIETRQNQYLLPLILEPGQNSGVFHLKSDTVIKFIPPLEGDVGLLLVKPDNTLEEYYFHDVKTSAMYGIEQPESVDIGRGSRFVWFAHWNREKPVWINRSVTGARAEMKNLTCDSREVPQKFWKIYKILNDGPHFLP